MINRSLHKLSLTAGALVLGTSLMATPASLAGPQVEKVSDFLKRFQKNPSAVINEAPPIWNVQGKPARAQQSSKRSLKDQLKYVEQRDKLRSKMSMEVTDPQTGQTTLIRLNEVEPGRAPIEDNDRPEKLVDVKAADFVNTLEKMHGGLQRAKLTGSRIPWSDNYWPIYQGVLGARYMVEPFSTFMPSPGQPAALQQFLEPLKKATASSIAETGKPYGIEFLSPSEKYDLLVGTNGALTKAMWEQARGSADENGNVETWMGVCHGWAPAAYMLPRPAKMVTLKSADGRYDIPFFPSDIKALATLLWAQTSTPTKFIGGRCNDKKPETDKENGRIKSQACFDTNPGSWHMAIVNQLGKAKKSMVMDATYDYEVWNQPVLGYEYSYFNPLTLDETDSLEKAKVSMSEFAAKDKFHKYRSSDAATVVGVAMVVTYVVETRPTHAKTDSPLNDASRSVRYVYDLELDRNGKIIGGEWYENMHPDFLWTPMPNRQAQSVGDQFLKGAWKNKSQSVPNDWSNPGQEAAEQGQPLAKVVRRLIDWANQK